MNRRIKIIYLFTIFGIVAFCCLEGYWLYQQYFSFLQDEAGGMFLDIVATIDKEVETQTKTNIGDLHGIYRVNNVSKGDTTCYSGYIVILSPEIETSQEWANEITDSIDKGLIPGRAGEIFRFSDIDVSNANTKEFSDAMTRCLAFRDTPINIKNIEKAVEKNFGTRCHAEITQEDPNKLWQSKLILPENVLHPQVSIVYPFNPIGGNGIKVIVDISIESTIKEMALMLCVSLTVAIMLITCLVLQIKTIRRQQKIADFQKGYTLTMLHELKRPISALKIFISFMRNPRVNESDRRESLENGAKEVDNLASYFEKLRAITYSETNDIPLTLSTFNLTNVAKECASKSQANILIHSEDSVIITAERQGIINVLANLIENAVKYSPINSLIDIDIIKRDTMVEISVADRGCGVSEADKVKIFERFYRVGDSKDVPGIGLGLAYVNQVVSAHGGEVSVADRDGGGTIFTIKIPQ